MPDNKQIDETLSYVTSNSPVDLDKLSPEGKKLIQDTRDIIETTRNIVAEQNADQFFQNSVCMTTRDIDVSAAKKEPIGVLPVVKEKAQADGQTGM